MKIIFMVASERVGPHTETVCLIRILGSRETKTKTKPILYEWANVEKANAIDIYDNSGCVHVYVSLCVQVYMNTTKLK